MLKIILEVTSRQIDSINSGKIPQKQGKRGLVSFVREGQLSYYKKKVPTKNDESWNGTWEIAADLPGHMRFFPLPTRKKPDLVVWCPERRIVYLVELTVPHEDNIDAARERKDNRYEDLVKECDEAGWFAAHFSVEVGCRGYVGERLRKWFSKIGLSMHQSNAAINVIQATVEKASHWIWLKRDDERWLE